MAFHIMTIGWEPDFIDRFATPVAHETGYSFSHALIGQAARIAAIKKRDPSLDLMALFDSMPLNLPKADDDFLSSLESPEFPTVKSMILGDPVLRHLPAAESMAYADFLARRMMSCFQERKPDVILASNDGLHSAMSLAVAKHMGIPWVAMAFTVIPEDRTGFIYALTPDCLLPIGVQPDAALIDQAQNLMANVRAQKQKVVAYKAPMSLGQWVRQYALHIYNFVNRYLRCDLLGVHRFTYCSMWVRFRDVIRRSINRLRLPEQKMLQHPPEGRFAYYPFHMSPESMIDTWAPFYQNQISFLEQLARAMPADVTLVAKLHFSDPDNYAHSQLEKLMRIPGVCIAHPHVSGASFLEKAALVIGITGTSCLEAALRGKPVLVFGDTPYQHFPRTQRAERPDKLYSQITNMLSLGSPSEEEILSAYVTYLARYRLGRINDWARPITPDEHERYADCFRALHDYLEQPEIRTNWYNRPPFVV